MKANPRVLFVLLTILAACEQRADLNREKAAKLLRDHVKSPVLVYEEVTAGRFQPQFGSERMYEALQQDGLIHYKISRGALGLPSAEVTVTSAGNKYVIGKNEWGSSAYQLKVKTCEKKITNVTGITKIREQNAAQVEFEVMYTRHTPFGRRLGPCAGSSQNYKGMAVFTLYDDGWRVALVQW